MKPKTKPQPTEETPAAGQIAVHCAHAKMVDVVELIPNPRNPNKHGDKQVAMLAKIIRHQGWRAPITVSKRSGFIVTGHGRLEAAKLLQVQTVPVDFQDFATEADEWAHLVADNRIAELAEIDSGELSGLLKELEASGMDLDLAGFDTEALMEVEGFDAPDSEVDAEPQEDKAEELRAKWGVESGQLWELGDHRLLCGDSTKKEDVERVMGGEKPNAIVTDPPYGIGKLMHGGTWATKQDAQFSKMREWDDKTSQSFFDHILSFGVPSVVWGGNYFSVPPSRCWLVWDKPEFPTMSSAELAWTNLDANTKRIECLRAHQADGSKDHATQKPIKVISWSLSFVPEGLLYEPFSGSGTTIIACEQLGRKCRAIEISPAYVAVALQRWADATGKTPKLIDG